MIMRDVPNMDSSFYEENSTQLAIQTPTTASTTGGSGATTLSTTSSGANTVGVMKRPLTLDLNKDLHPAKKGRFNNNASVISTPDLQMLKMVSPELEKFIMNGNPMATPTPGQHYPQKEESLEAREVFAKGFEEALSRLQNNDQINTATTGPLKQMIINNNNSLSVNNNTRQPPSNVVTISSSNPLGMSGGTVTYQNLDEPLPLNGIIKEEPQTVPGSPTSSFCPVDMDEQERQKLERKRQRNRVAASKCRKRKLERISKLEDKVKGLKGENSELSSVVNNLKQHVVQLKQQILDHVNAGCKIPFHQF